MPSSSSSSAAAAAPALLSVAITSSLFTSGFLSATSLLLIPSLLSAPHTIAARQFKLQHQSLLPRGAAGLSVALTALLYAWAGYSRHQFRPGMSWVPALLTAAILPWTYFVMEPLGQQLRAIAGTGETREGGTEVGARTEGLLRGWSRMNGVRGALALAAGAVGLWGVLA